MHNDGSQFSLPVIFNHVSGPLTHAKKSFLPTRTNRKFNKMHAILPRLSYLHNIPLSHQKNQKTDTCCTLMDVI